MNSKKKLQILLEMRPAFDGYAGIPQETRLLFRGLCMTDLVEVEGLLQTSHRFLAAGTKIRLKPETECVEASRLHRYSRVIISIETKPSTKPLDEVMRYLKKQRIAIALTLSALLLPNSRKIKTSRFESRYFEDFIWRTLFAKTLPAADFAIVTARNHRVCSVPWNTLQTAGLNSLKFVAKPVYPVLDTQGFDIFIAQTPYPARVDKKTALVVRYHDAVPVFMPHAVAHKSRHEATHYYALMSNVQSGAYFACVSETTRQDLLRLFPEVQNRAITIHNMVSHHFYDEDSSAVHALQIIRSRLNLLTPEAHPAFNSIEEQEGFYKNHLGLPSLNYLLIVSTIEPRKNHSRLIAAWELIRAEINPAMKLVIVGNLGWDFEHIMQEMRTWIDQGELFVLSNVHAADLRVLYRHAAATVCPSLAEGFDYSGVESMRSGGNVIASDIPVHREIYADAAEYFDPYCTVSLADTVKKVLFDQNASQVQEKLRVNGKKVSARYLPENILPQWEKFLQQVNQTSANR
ncbi:MAG: glycosyltransferase family 1 protein [Gallionella sp.]|nr:glycosyltransferase family 1 protein [Gallionella sp.]